MVRTGKQYVDAIKRRATVYIGGEEVNDVTTHPAFRNSVGSVARLYDITADPANAERLTYREEETGERCNLIFLRPRSQDDLRARRQVHEAWADATWGMLGRAPDHVAAFITGMACKPDVFDLHQQGFSANILNYWRYIRDNDLFLAYAVVPPAGAKGSEAVATPQARASTDSSWGENAGLRVVREDDDGVVVWGFKILGTGAILADEVLVGNVLPLAPGEEKFAITFALPVDAPGLKLISRRPYERLALSELDDPLAFRYDETDAVVFCDNVKVPWERIFAHNHIDTARAIFYDTPAHTLGNAQAHIRLLPKLRLMLGVIKRVAEVNGIAQIPAVRDTIFGLAVRVAMVEGLIRGQEARPEQWPNGFVTQDRQTMYATMSWTMESYPDFVKTVRELLGSHPFQQPADASVFENETTAEMFAKFAMAEPPRALETYKLMRLAWDLVGSEFASRHIQYEMFYAGPRHVTRGRAGYFFRWDVIDKEAQRALASIGGYDTLITGRAARAVNRR
jgi:4-hydroxyphenylacetate 3-monooxygenase